MDMSFTGIADISGGIDGDSSRVYIIYNKKMTFIVVSVSLPARGVRIEINEFIVCINN